MLIPIILCGGLGTRLWPQSRKTHPKQLLKLFGDHSLLQTTLLRAKLISEQTPWVVCHHNYRFMVAEQLHEIGMSNVHILLEPQVCNTAMAMAAALCAIKQTSIATNDQLVFLPADHYIPDANALTHAITQATQEPTSNSLYVLGIKPQFASDAYGYIEVNTTKTGCVQQVKRFVEKPSVEQAETYLATGNFRWNAGIFISSCKTLEKLFTKHAPDILAAAECAVQNSQSDLDFCRLNETAYQTITPIAFDVAIAEKASNLKMVELDAEWSDLGAWQQIYQQQAKDLQGNVLTGDVFTHELKNSFINANHRLVSAIGLENIAIIETKDAVLVADLNQTQSVKSIVDQLHAQHRIEAQQHPLIHRPWGHYETLDIDHRFKVKRIIVKPGEHLSLQKHYHRSEHWVVVKGTAKVRCGEETYFLHENQSTYIPQLAAHQLENAGKIPLEIIEIQVGDYLGEDDIERYQDKCNREIDAKTCSQSYE